MARNTQAFIPASCSAVLPGKTLTTKNVSRDTKKSTGNAAKQRLTISRTVDEWDTEERLNAERLEDERPIAHHSGLSRTSCQRIPVLTAMGGIRVVKPGPSTPVAESCVGANANRNGA